LLWEKVITPLRPVAHLDGQAITLGAYTDILAYRQNVLLAEYEQAQQLAAQPTAAAGSGGNDFLAQYAQQQLGQIQNQLAGLNTQLVDDMVDERLVRAEAARRGLTATPDEVDHELKSLIGYQDPSATPTPVPASSSAPAADAAAQAPDAPAAPTATAVTSVPVRRPRDFEAVYRDYRRATAGTDAVIRADVTDQILRRKLDEQLSAAVPTQEEQVHARHILVPDETAAAAVLQRLNNGESFEALAAELSTDPGSKDQGGDLGWFPRGFMVGAFEDAAFKLQPGQVSDPIKTSFGVHIIRVDERAPARDLDPEQLQALQNSALPRWLEAERAKHKIENLLTTDQQDWAARNARKPSYGQS
jgi:parvulin-like peptidyl-prolyl isomerase